MTETTHDFPAGDPPRADVERFFAGLDLLSPYPGAEPAVTHAGLWDAEDIDAADTDGQRGVCCGVARRPEGFGAHDRGKRQAQ